MDMVAANTNVHIWDTSVITHYTRAVHRDLRKVLLCFTVITLTRSIPSCRLKNIDTYPDLCDCLLEPALGGGGTYTAKKCEGHGNRYDDMIHGRNVV